MLTYDFEGRILTLMCGLPYAGKTTWLRERSWTWLRGRSWTGLAIVSPDAIRLALTDGTSRFTAGLEPYVWAIATTMVRSLFLSGSTGVVIDATHTTEKRRRPWVDEAAKLGIELRLIHLLTPIDQCLERALDAEDEEILPVIRRMWSQWEDPDPETWKPSERFQGEGVRWYELR